MRCHQFDHFAGADKQHLDVAQVFEQLRCEPHRRCRHADRVRANLGRGAHILGDRERSLEQLMQGGAQGAGGICFAHRLLHLAQDLGLAQHHRVEPGGDPEGMACGVLVLEHIGVLPQLFAADAALRREPVDCWADQRVDLSRFGRDVELGAVAGRQQRRLRQCAHQALAKTPQRRRELFGGKRKTTAQINRRGHMVQTQREHTHG